MTKKRIKIQLQFIRGLIGARSGYDWGVYINGVPVRSFRNKSTALKYIERRKKLMKKRKKKK